MVRHILCAIFLAMVSANLLAHDDILLGVLEDVPGTYAGQGHSSKVRLLFVHKGSKWFAYPSKCDAPECWRTVTSQYPREVHWFVGLDGRKIAEIVARTPDDFKFYSKAGLQDIVSGTPPVIGKPSYEFSGWLSDKVRRPLVTVSKPYFKDPAHWKRVTTTPQIQKQGATLLRNQVPRVCQQNRSETELLPFRYGASDMEIRAHRSSSGWVVMTINIKGLAYYCDHKGAGPGVLDDQTFAISPTGKAQFLGSGLKLIDAGDYDGDGRSELIFALSLYNRGGYVLFSDDFIEQARFVFGYH